jgi:hypothetical protein
MAKMTVYVPGNLKSRMDQAEGVNWSPLACKAFEVKLAEIINTKGAKDMQDVITRLKASKSKTDDENRIRGRGAGKQWASNQAEAAELERLEAWTEKDLGGRSWQSLLEQPGRPENAFGEDLRLVETITKENVDRRYSDRFWEVITDNKADRRSGTFLIGFVEGALEVWEAVKNQL